MEENVALDTAKQKKFVKSIKGIKKLIKKTENEKPTVDENVKTKDGKAKRKRPERGLVYLSHIPHGFYEHQMTQYFKQFGVVTNARVIRSKRTGNSKGCAFVEFKETAVAEIVAETMNNYLMGKRLIKAAYVPPEKQRPKAFRKHWSRFNNPGRDARLKIKKSFNENKDEAGDLKRARKILANLNKTKKKLSDMGINYDFFTPVDVPEALQDSLKQNDNGEDKKIKNDKKQKDVNTNFVKIDKNAKVGKENNKTLEIEKSKVKVETKPIKEKKKDLPPVVNKKEQKQKQQKLKDTGVKPPENFVKVEENSGDSDSSMEFDSDEYEKMLGDDSEVDSNESDEDDGGDSDDDDDSGNDDDSEEIDDSEDEEIIPPKKSKGPIKTLQQPMKQGKQKGKSPEQVKRKEPQKTAAVTKKPKFEKQTQFKKKK